MVPGAFVTGYSGKDLLHSAADKITIVYHADFLGVPFAFYAFVDFVPELIQPVTAEQQFLNIEAHSIQLFCRELLTQQGHDGFFWYFLIERHTCDSFKGNTIFRTGSGDLKQLLIAGRWGFHAAKRTQVVCKQLHAIAQNSVHKSGLPCTMLPRVDPGRQGSCPGWFLRVRIWNRNVGSAHPA